jgi:hypothetical protein
MDDPDFYQWRPLSMLVVLRRALASFLFSLSAPLAGATTLYLEFSGTLNINDFSTANFFAVPPGNVVSGLLLIDDGAAPRNISSTPDTQLFFSPGIFPGRELALVETHINGLEFDFSQANSDGLDRDSLFIGPLGEEQSFAVTDAYRRETLGKCLGEPQGPDFCWTVQLGAVLPANTLAVAWPQTFDVRADEPTSSLSIRFLFFNRDPAKGRTGLMSGSIVVERISVTPR